MLFFKYINCHSTSISFSKTYTEYFKVSYIRSNSFLASTIDWYSASTGGSLLLAGSTNYTVNVTATTTFYATSRDTVKECVSSTRTAVTATVNALPATPTSISGTLSVCPGATTNYTYTASTVRGVAGYVWTTPVCATGTSSTNSITIRLTGAGTNDSIFVQTRNTPGCLRHRRGVKITTATSCPACVAPALITRKFSNVDPRPSEEIVGLILRANPNPSLNLFRIQLWSSDQTTPIHLRIIDITGRVMEDHGKLNPGTVKEIGALYRNGIYIVEATQALQNKKIKLVKGR